MRKILFRGKRLDNGEWVYGYYAELPAPSLSVTIMSHGDVFAEDTVPCIISIKEKQHPYFSSANPVCIVEAEQHPVEPATVGQYTGLCDKTGKWIFEGDIVEMHQFLFDGNEYEHETKGAIKWGEYGWLLSQIEGEAVNKYMGYKNGEGETYFINFYGLHEESFEVIGTIHDNPDLLEEE